MFFFFRFYPNEYILTINTHLNKRQAEVWRGETYLSYPLPRSYSTASILGVYKVPQFVFARDAG